MTVAIALPLARWADAQLRAMAQLTDSPAIADLSGATLLGERAILNGFQIPGRVSAGGGCGFFDSRTDPIALNLSRPDDRDLLPALFQDAAVDCQNDANLIARFQQERADEIVARGRMLGLAIAGLNERPASPASILAVRGDVAPHRPRRLLVLDLTALWAGPLAGHLLGLTGAHVVKVESVNRPDSMREGDPALFARLNQGKANVALDLRLSADREQLITLIRQADVVLEAARPRALLQLGIDADQLVRETAGLVWITITGHGVAGEACNWIGFGDDCSVAGGLSAELFAVTGKLGFAGDACADPLTGIYATREAIEHHERRSAARIIISMSGVVADALATEREGNPTALRHALMKWAEAQGEAFPSVPMRPSGPAAATGEDNIRWLGSSLPC